MTSSMASSKSLPEALSIQAKPYQYVFPPKHTALLVIDMQRDFLLPGGFGHIQGGNLEAVQASIARVQDLLVAFRGAEMAIFHTREGHKPDLSDCPSSKLVRQVAAPGNTQHRKIIGDAGEMGRLLIVGEYGHDIVDDLQPYPGEIVIDKSGKGAFFNTSLSEQLKAKGITHLVICGVTTECCFATTLREANDRGFECCENLRLPLKASTDSVAGGIEEATAGYNNAFKGPTLDMIYWSQGLFGFIAPLQPLLEVLNPYVTRSGAGLDTTPPQTPPGFDGDLSIEGLQKAYRAGLSPLTVAENVLDRIEKYEKVDSAVWIRLEPKAAVLERVRQLQIKYPDKTQLPPLFGVPFSVKDSIDVAGIETTTACPPLAHVATTSAPAYETLISHGALYIGKTNLDQLATGLTGCRSPHGIPRSVFNPSYISGGSSSGNAVSVGANLVSFSLATDTAGSGRVPAGFNGIIGYKPTRGLISALGVTPACLSLDCIALMAHTVSDARSLGHLLTTRSPADPYSKLTYPLTRPVHATGPRARTFTFATPPPSALTICHPAYQTAFNTAISTLQTLGGTPRPINWSPFQKAGALLYDGCFVSERLASLPDTFLSTNLPNLHPTVAEIFTNVTNRHSTAVQAFRDIQAQAVYTRQAQQAFAADAGGVDVLVVPTAPTQWTVEEALAEPTKRNSVLGEYTHFGNVVDLCAVAVPAGTVGVAEMVGGKEGGGEVEVRGEGRLPFGVTFLGGSQMDAEVLEIARRFEVAVGLAGRA